MSHLTFQFHFLKWESLISVGVPRLTYHFRKVARFQMFQIFQTKLIEMNDAHRKQNLLQNERAPAQKKKK